MREGIQTDEWNMVLPALCNCFVYAIAVGTILADGIANSGSNLMATII